MSENSRARTRQLERHGTASIRALSATPDAEYRARRLRVNDKPIAFATPYLVLDFATASLVRSRAVVDALAARLTHSDSQLHQLLSPHKPIARVVFDILEQIRCESLGPDHLVGMRENLDRGFAQW